MATSGPQINAVMHGLNGLAANFYAKNKNAAKYVKDVVGRNAALIQTRTIDLCPKDTFYMSEHVRADFSKDGYNVVIGWDAKDFLGTLDEKGHARAFYPPYVEFGTRHMMAQPSLSIAYQEQIPIYRQELNAALRRAMEGI